MNFLRINKTDRRFLENPEQLWACSDRIGKILAKQKGIRFLWIPFCLFHRKICPVEQVSGSAIGNISGNILPFEKAIYNDSGKLCQLLNSIS
jgi:hypothetical protein